MSIVVGVHGIGQEFKGEHTLISEWLPALRDGLARADSRLPGESVLACPFYGDLFRPKGTKLPGEPPYQASDVTDDEAVLLELWWREAARVDRGVTPPDARTKGRTPPFVQRALNALSYSQFFAGLAERAFIGDLRQVVAYVRDDDIRNTVQQRVTAAVDHDTRVVIGHSLGSVVAYEALSAHPEWPVRVFVTLGSPLGIRNVIYDRLRPPPADGRGAWPGSVSAWVNIADDGDIVALVKNLATCFGDRVEDRRINNGATAHNIRPYLTAQETGEAIARAFNA